MIQKKFANSRVNIQLFEKYTLQFYSKFKEINSDDI